MTMNISLTSTIPNSYCLVSKTNQLAQNILVGHTGFQVLFENYLTTNIDEEIPAVGLNCIGYSLESSFDAEHIQDFQTTYVCTPKWRLIHIRIETQYAVNNLKDMLLAMACSSFPDISVQRLLFQ